METEMATQQGRNERIAHVQSVDWHKVRSERSAGVPVPELAKKYGVSEPSIYKYTRTAKSKATRVHWTQTPGGKKRMAEISRQRHNGASGRTTLTLIPTTESPTSVREAIAQCAEALRAVTIAFDSVTDRLDDVLLSIGEDV